MFKFAGLKRPEGYLEKVKRGGLNVGICEEAMDEATGGPDRGELYGQTPHSSRK
ncbi:MAG: hypothetical protein QXG39_06630 [Candidatus Aenigmatarchaeota archaeon]